jgi:hypothetical protein
MIHRVSDAIGMRGPSERNFWRPGRWLTIALAITASGLTACGDGGGDEISAAPDADRSVSAPVKGDRERIVIKTQIRMFAGKVLTGSVIGDSPFCPGGTVRHEPGSMEIGHPAVNVFRCPDGQLEIGFGPGPDQMNNAVQTSDWEVLDGSGRFEDINGHGQMTVRWEKVGSPNGRETFTGTVVAP